VSFDPEFRSQADQAATETTLGVALAEQGKLAEAIFHLRTAIRLQPDFAKAHHNLGVALAQQGQDAEAIQSLRRALELKPDYVEAYYNLGNVFMSQAKHAEAVDCYQRVLEIKPDYYEAYNNLGLSLTELGRLGKAVVFLQQGVRLRPQSAEAHNNLGMALTEQAQWADADACYEQALRIDPNYAEAHVNRGNNFKEQGRLDEALACYQLALWIKPDSGSAHWNRSLAWLQKGDYEHGWAEYEWRWRRKQTPPRLLPGPGWDGSPLAGRAILLYMEQGLGDMLQFIRYAALVKERGGTVIVECPPFLIPLFSRCRGIDQVVAEGSALPAFDVHAPLMSLPGLLGTTLATIPATVPYLFPEPHLVEEWGRRMKKGGRNHFERELPVDLVREPDPLEMNPDPFFRIGIAWQGNRYHKWDRHRSIPLTQFAPLAQLPGVELISLQKGYGSEQVAALAGRFPVTELAGEVNATPGAFMDTAAIMKHLDLVITVDTAIAHLAGGLGVPVWVALSTIADWRWLQKRDDSPWYPTMRLFRQSQLGDWVPVFERMAAESHLLHGLRDERASSTPGA
jgi:tetratricopeptide (TPR) repeat protein